ncbi:MAG TPA: trigger factor [Gammaproteobacteria bacterium]|jgi:trigger factor|nr:trigger factor [Gammaproteobacteria bacterium]HJP42295.1 trigger factor [Gammaproteobacteria bacterium]
MSNLKIKVNSKKGLVRDIHISVPSNVIEEKRNTRFSQLSKTAKLPGFRPGKVPEKVIRRQYADQVLQEVLSDVLETTYMESIQEKNLQPAGPPKVALDEYVKEKDFSYTATIEVYPEFDLKGLDKIKVEKPHADITQKDINAMMDNLQNQKGTWEKVDRISKGGDQLLIDFEGKIDGVVFDGGTAKDFAMQLGNGQMLPEFDESLIGVKSEETKTIELTFPDNYHKKELVGKQALFTVDVKEVRELKPAELDQKFVQSFGIKSGDQKELMDEVKSSMSKELEARINNEIRQNLMKFLKDKNAIEIPEVMIHQEAHAMQKDWMNRSGIEDHEQAPPLDDFNEIAKERVHLGLLVSKLVQSKEIKLDPDKVKTKLDELSKTYPNPEEIRKMYEQSSQLMDQLKSLVMEDQVIDWLIERTEFQKKEMEFKELVNRS